MCHIEGTAEAKISVTLVRRGEFYEAPSINHDLCMVYAKTRKINGYVRAHIAVCLPANNSQAMGGTRLETSISFPASFAAETLLFAIMSVTNGWESVAPGMSHPQTTNFRFASQNDPSSAPCHREREVCVSVGTCLGRESIGASDGCFWPSVLATCKLFTP